jgi:serine/threonine protein kinase
MMDAPTRGSSPDGGLSYRVSAMAKFSTIYTLKRPIGFGGFATAWEAKRVDGYAVAVKNHDVGVPSGILRLADEARVLASLDHPNVVRVYGYGRTDVPVRGTPAGAPFLVMELASAGTLDERAWPETWQNSASILLEVLGAAAPMHARHIVHRDTKPSNVLFAEGGEPSLRIADFGIAHPTNRVSRAGRKQHTFGTSERPFGTPRYATLEQRLGKWREYGS